MLGLDSGTTGVTLAESESSAFQIFAGLDINRRLAVEGFYTDLGSGKLTNDESIAYTAAGLNTVLYLIPGVGESGSNRRNGFSLFGKLGVAAIDTESNVAIEQKNALNLTTGLGVEYGFNSGVGLRAGFNMHDADARHLQLSLVYRLKSPTRKSSDQIPDTTTVSGDLPTITQPLSVEKFPEPVGQTNTAEQEATATDLQIEPLPERWTAVPQPNAAPSINRDQITEPLPTLNTDAQRQPSVITPEPLIDSTQSSSTISSADSSSGKADSSDVTFPNAAAQGRFDADMSVEVMTGAERELPDLNGEPDSEIASNIPSLADEGLKVEPIPEPVSEPVSEPTPPKPLPEPAPVQIADLDGDGITDSKDRCAGSSARLRVDSRGCSQIAGIVDAIRFESDSAVLTLEAKSVLNDVAEYMQTQGRQRFSVFTIPAASGNADVSEFLAKRRTLAVVRYLIARDIAGSRLKAAITLQNPDPVENRDKSRSWVVFKPL